MKIKNKNLIFVFMLYIVSVLFIINIRTNSVGVSSATCDTMLIPSGQAIAMKLKTKGVLVVGVKIDQNLPAKVSGIKNGDIIERVNDVAVVNTSHFEDILKASNGSELTLYIERNNEEIITNVTPWKNESGQYVCGMWLRDSAAGIGTISFFTDDKKNFAALGHPINDMDTDKTYDVRWGNLELVDIKGAKMGAKNNPGELLGVMSGVAIGNISVNNQVGIYGSIANDRFVLGEKIPIALKKDVKLGKATILSTVSEKGVEEFEIEIVKVSDNKDNKDFIVKITDERLLAQTGGIVQGMSGSPILQDGKIIGAITHVMLNDAKKGFGISIEKMLK